MSSEKKVSLLVAERHKLVREALCALLEVEADFVLAGQAQTGREAVELARVLRPDVIVMDIAVPVIGGLDAAQAILAADPYARILVLSAYNDREYRELANTIGAAGFLEKQASASDFKRTIREIAAGRPLPPPGAAAPARSRAPATLPRASPRLTPRETEVLHLVAEGFPNKRAAVELGISVRTVEKHRQHLSGKLDLHSTAELTRYAMAARDSRSLGD